MRSFTDIFIKRPVLAVVINLMILAVGWRAVSSLPVRQYPRIESSSIIITTVYSARVRRRSAVHHHADRAGGLGDRRHRLHRAPRAAGMSTITVHLRLNHSSNAALAEISARLNQVRSRAAAGVPRSPVVEIQRTDKPYATFYSQLHLRRPQPDAAQRLPRPRGAAGAADDHGVQRCGSKARASWRCGSGS